MRPSFRVLKLFEIVKKKKTKTKKKKKKKKKKFLTEIYQSNTPALTKIEEVFQYKMIK